MLSNPDLKWETTISRNIGLDFGFFNNRLSGTIDAYWNTTKDLLMCIPIDELQVIHISIKILVRPQIKVLKLL